MSFHDAGELDWTPDHLVMLAELPEPYRSHTVATTHRGEGGEVIILTARDIDGELMSMILVAADKGDERPAAPPIETSDLPWWGDATAAMVRHRELVRRFDALLVAKLERDLAQLNGDDHGSSND